MPTTVARLTFRVLDDILPLHMSDTLFRFATGASTCTVLSTTAPLPVPEKVAGLGM